MYRKSSARTGASGKAVGGKSLRPPLDVGAPIRPKRSISRFCFSAFSRFSSLLIETFPLYSAGR
jgi:hypothetical protein